MKDHHKERGSRGRFCDNDAFVTKTTPRPSCFVQATENTFRVCVTHHSGEQLFQKKKLSRRITMIWEIDPTHSHLSFAIRVLSVSTTRGRFHALRGHLHIDEQNPANSWVEAEVEAASIDTRNKLRDAHLRSAAFFAVKQYPTITFQSTNVEYAGDQDYKVTGNLTMHGVTRPIVFDV